ncbi:flagellar basal body-associated FliL family protein [Piscinibacter sp. XHJ-5]|uniref:flagellar basal body-associated FliL family protein n=1 Tax=Piscinibacter sp. XHJ-5 TaxID=3037797 RepID=UPI0024531811|nr:flagellar basal body-associated FliL family protein [Piscinibacter sp. XHJ-5]
MPPAPLAPPPRSSDTRRVLLIVAAIATIIAVPMGIVGGIRWLNLADSWTGAGRAQPKWVTSGEVRATTRDGTLVKTRVAFDAGDASTKSAVQRRLREVSLLLELSIGAFSTLELAGPHGIERLSQDMLKRVNAYLATDGVAPMKAVAIQDLWYTRP